MSWIDEDDERRKKSAKGSEILEAKARRFFDSLCDSVNRDARELKAKRSIPLLVVRPRPEEILVKKDLPHPIFSITASLDQSSSSIKVTWYLQEEYDQQNVEQSSRWHLRLDSNESLHVTADEDEISPDQASERMFRRILDRYR